MHVLLVEDERMIATDVKRGLEEHGYAVDVAFTGTEALDWLLSWRDVPLTLLAAAPPS